MVYTRPTTSKAVLFISEDFVSLEVLLKPFVENTGVNLSNTADYSYAPVLKGIPIVLFRFGNGYNVTKTPICRANPSLKAKIKKIYIAKVLHYHFLMHCSVFQEKLSHFLQPLLPCRLPHKKFHYLR